MSETSGGLPLMAQTQSSRYLTYNEAMWAINVLQTGVLDRDLTSPPGSPAEGDAYIVKGTATGAWAGKEDKIAFYFGSVWNFLEPELAQGDGLYVVDEDVRVRWTGSAYEIPSGSEASSIPYTPGPGAVWGSPVPSTVGEALDQASSGGGGGGGGGIDTTTAVHASRPAAGNAGNLFLPNDSFYIERDTGAAWAPWGPIYPMTLPIDGDFSWVNQGTATLVTTQGGIHLTTTAVTGANIRVRTKSSPATPYTITAALTPLLYGVNYHACGIGFRESGTGELHLFTFVHDLDWVLTSTMWNSPTSFANHYTTASLKIVPQCVFLQISDDGSNRICRWSLDGQNFTTLHTVGRTNFLTADQVCFFVHADNATYPAAMTLLSWKQT